MGKFSLSRRGNLYVLAAICNFSKEVFVTAVKDLSAASYRVWLEGLFQVHGIPEVLISDNGTNFVANSSKAFLQKCGVRHILSPPYHPQSNGDIERFNRTLGSAVKACSDGSGADPEWDARLWEMTLAYNNSKHASTLLSPVLVSRGARLRQILDLDPEEEGVRPDVHAARLAETLEHNFVLVSENLKASMLRNERPESKESMEQKLVVGSLVWVLISTESGVKKLSDTWEGPMRIISALHDDIFIVEDVARPGRTQRRHRSHLLQYEGAAELRDEFPALPTPFRGGGGGGAFIYEQDDDDEIHGADANDDVISVHSDDEFGSAGGSSHSVSSVSSDGVYLYDRISDGDYTDSDAERDGDVSAASDSSDFVPPQAPAAVQAAQPAQGVGVLAREAAHDHEAERLEIAGSPQDLDVNRLGSSEYAKQWLPPRPLEDIRWIGLDNTTEREHISMADIGRAKEWPEAIISVLEAVDVCAHNTKKGRFSSVRKAMGTVRSTMARERLREVMARPGWTDRKVAIATAIFEHVVRN